MKTMSERLHKAEIHCFSQDGRHILLDVRQSRVFGITPLERDILTAPQGTPLEALLYELRKEHEAGKIERALESLKGLGIIAFEPLPLSEVGEVLPSIITDLELNIAQDCNLRCRYCIVEQGGFGARRYQMSPEVGRQAVDFVLRESGEEELCYFTFFGGEPMLNFGLIEDMVAYSQAQAARHGKRMAYLIVTNGTLFEDDNIAFIKKHKISVQVSLDGPPAVHDRLRPMASGRGSYATIVAHLPQLLADYAERVSIRATVTRYNSSILELLDHLTGLGVGRVGLNYVEGDGDDYALDLPAREQLKVGYAELARRFLAGAPEGDFSAAGFFAHFMAHFCSGLKRRTYCGAGVRMLGVSASGGLYPCPYLAEREDYRVGHVATGVDRERLARWRSYLDVDRKPLCQSCWARYMCGGGCLSAAIKYGGTPHRPYEADCDLIRHLAQLIMWIYLELKEKHPDAFLQYLLQSPSSDMRAGRSIANILRAMDLGVTRPPVPAGERSRG